MEEGAEVWWQLATDWRTFYAIGGLTLFHHMLKASFREAHDGILKDLSNAKRFGRDTDQVFEAAWRSRVDSMGAAIVLTIPMLLVWPLLAVIWIFRRR